MTRSAASTTLSISSWRSWSLFAYGWLSMSLLFWRSCLPMWPNYRTFAEVLFRLCDGWTCDAFVCFLHILLCILLYGLQSANWWIAEEEAWGAHRKGGLDGSLPWVDQVFGLEPVWKLLGVWKQRSDCKDLECKASQRLQLGEAFPIEMRLLLFIQEHCTPGEMESREGGDYCLYCWEGHGVYLEYREWGLRFSICIKR